MAQVVGIEAKERKEQGSRASKKLRAKGHVPAVVYGHKEANLNVTISGDEIQKIIRQGARVVDLKAAGKTEKALIREVQWDAFGQVILHVDFARVSEGERITIDVRVELRGMAPGVTGGGVLVQPIHNLHVECSVIAVPDSIRVSIAELQLDQAIHVKDLKLPEGVKVLNDPEAIVVQVVPQTAEEAPVLGEGGGAEPEVIGRAAKDEEAEAE